MNYFEYFTEIEERFTARRGSLLLLSTLDWALVETWREAGVPLPAVLRGIDLAFDRHEARKARAGGRIARVNGLAWCAGAVMEAATELAQASVGLQSPPTGGPESGPVSGFESDRIVRFLEGNAEALDRAAEVLPPAAPALASTATRLRELAAETRTGAHPALDELDRTLTVFEERLLATLVTALPESELLALRETADRELTPIRARIGAVAARQMRDRFVQKRLFDLHGIPRLSLFHMPLADSTDSPSTHPTGGEAAA